MSRVLHRIRTWTLCHFLELRCAIIGHRYGRHFTDMGAASDDDHETPWCYRCGHDEEPLP